MQSDTKKIDADITNNNHKQAGSCDKGWTPALPTTAETSVEIRGIHKPADQRPGLLRIPTPPTTPSLIGPNSTTNDPHSEQQKPHRDCAIAQTVELLSAAEVDG